MRLFGSVLFAVFVASCAGADSSSKTTEETTSSPQVGTEQQCLLLANKRPKPIDVPPNSVTVRHILVKHADSKNPREGVTRTRGQACMRAAEARDKILAGAKFDDMVVEYSDEAGASTVAGLLGEIRRGEVDPAFADTAFDLSPDQMSDVVETPNGFHLIFRSQ